MSEIPFSKQCEDYFRACGPERWGVRYRWEPCMPFVFIHEAKAEKWCGPFLTRNEAETLRDLLIMTKNHEGKQREASGNTRAAIAAWQHEYEVAVFNVPAVAVTMKDERQIALDESRFPTQAQE